MILFFHHLSFASVTDICGYSDPLTVTVLVNPMLPKIITESKYLLSVTLLPCPEDVTLSEDVCTCIASVKCTLSIDQRKRTAGNKNAQS